MQHSFYFILNSIFIYTKSNLVNTQCDLFWPHIFTLLFYSFERFFIPVLADRFSLEFEWQQGLFSVMFRSMIKFPFLAQFPVDQLSHPVIPFAQVCYIHFLYDLSFYLYHHIIYTSYSVAYYRFWFYCIIGP